MIIKKSNEILNLLKTFFFNKTVLWRHQKVIMNFDEDTLLLLLAIFICQTVIVCQLPFKKHKKCKIWVKEWLHCQEMLGAYNSIVSELQLQDCYSYRRYLKMNCETFKVEKYSCLWLLYLLHNITSIKWQFLKILK